MSSKKWIAAFLGTVLAIVLLIAAFNFITDPFGVFPGELLEWPSYEMTVNPRTAKVTWLKKHWQEYDSYIIGCSSTSSFSPVTFGGYWGADFYNMIMYGADMLDAEQLARWLTDNCRVENLVLNVYLDNAVYYDTLPDPLSYAMLPEVTGERALPFYLRYLFCDPRHGLDKLKAMARDTYMTQPFDVFDEATGAYDKKVRDAEAIGSLERYYMSYPAFADYPEASLRTNETAVQGTLRSVAAIRDLCEERGVALYVVCAPVYADYLDWFPREQVEDFYARLAEVTPYWDFSRSSVSFEPRYFYDETHFRNCVGDMAAARMTYDGEPYVPEDFGAYVRAETAAAHQEALRAAAPLPEEAYTADVPVLMYHHIDEVGNDSTAITPELFEAQMKALRDAGYESVTPDDLIAYVRRGEPLPEKPVVITFDDGYLSNYEYAWPILERYGFRATIFVIGSTVGCTEHYKDTDFPITPHFSWAQAAEMVSSGVISVQSHTFDMHQWAPYESGKPRESILRWEGESEADYRAALAADCGEIAGLILSATGERAHVLAYPNGLYDDLAQVTVLENGFDVTFDTEFGSNTLIKGMPQSLYGLNRFTMNESVSVETMLEWVSTARG